MFQRIVFFITQIFTFFYFEFDKIFFLRPQSVHQWRQCDSAAYALNYFQNEQSNFFFPQVMNYWAHNSHVISELPIIYWISGNLYHLFGFQEGIVRVVSYVFFVVGLYYLLLIGQKLFTQKWNAFIPIILVVSSPFLMYYSYSFLPNIPALALSIISWYYFLIYNTSNQRKHFYWMTFFSLLAALLKPIECFNYFTMLGILFLQYINAPLLTKRYLSAEDLKKLVISIITYFIILLSWIHYAKGYAHAFGYYGNLLGILPIWNLSSDMIDQTFDIISTKWAYQLFWNPGYYVFVAAFIWVCINIKKVDGVLRYALGFLIIFQLIYSILFFDPFYHHDYYMINLSIVIIFLSFAFIQVIERSISNKWICYSLLVFTIAFFFMTIKHSKHIVHERYYGFLREHVNPDLETITPYLRSIGIKNEDIVVSIPDPSPNISLYLMNQHGFSYKGEHFTPYMDYYLKRDAQYLIINESTTENIHEYTKVMRNKIGTYKSLSIYKL